MRPELIDLSFLPDIIFYANMNILNEVIIIILLIFSTVFSLSEMALVASRKIKLKKHADEGLRGTKLPLNWLIARDFSVNYSDRNYLDRHTVRSL